jgi:hypothetical protein
MSSQYYSATAYVGTPHRNAVEVTIPLVGPAGPQGPAGEGGGGDLTSPGPIGSVAPNTGAFTTLSATGVATLPHIHGSLAGNLYIHVKNTSGGQLTRGTPVCIVGNVGDTDRVEVAAADFDDATKMPAVGLLEQTLANNGTGDAVIVGELTSANTGSYSLNQELFVGNNGALTTTRPTSGEVQSVGTVSRVHASTGVIVVNMQGRRSPNEAFAQANHTHAASAITDLKSAGYAAGLWDNGPEPEGNKVGLVIADGELNMNNLAFLRTTNLTSPRVFEYPNAPGTLALTSDIPSGGSKTYAVFTATDNQPTATAFATLDTRNSIAVLDFDDATDESAVFMGIIPEAASLGSGLKIRLHWMATTATSGNVVWDVSLERMTTDLDSDDFGAIASGTAAANGTSGILTVTEITLTTIDSVTAGDGYRLKVTRDANNASDTMTGDAEFVVCEVRSAA